MKNRMPFLYGYMFIVVLSQGELHFVGNKAISVSNATFSTPVSNCPRTSSRVGLGFFLSSGSCHLSPVGSGSVTSYPIIRRFHRGPLALQSPPRPVQPEFSDGNTSGILDSLSLDAQWVTGFTDGEGCFNISA